MILCIDAGNSRLKWGLRDATGWREKGAQAYATQDAWTLLDAALPASIDRIVACNVAGAGVSARIEALALERDCRLDWFTSTRMACGVSNGYETAAQLGSDRWAALIGAHSLCQGRTVVVMAGTATTIDALDEGGRFLGGLILPGLSLMCAALARNTAALPEARGGYCPLPRNTDDAIVSGALHATLGAIGRMATQLGQGALCLLSGGAGAALAAQLEMPYRLIDNLVLEGLACYSGVTVGENIHLDSR